MIYMNNTATRLLSELSTTEFFDLRDAIRSAFEARQEAHMAAGNLDDMADRFAAYDAADAKFDAHIGFTQAPSSCVTHRRWNVLFDGVSIGWATKPKSAKTWAAYRVPSSASRDYVGVKIDDSASRADAAHEIAVHAAIHGL